MAQNAPRTTKPKSSSEEFDEFQKLAQKLVRVPKREIDAERAKQNGNGKKAP